MGGTGRDSHLRGRRQTGFSFAWENRPAPDGNRLCVGGAGRDSPLRGKIAHATRDSGWVRREACGTAEGAGRPNSGETMRVIERIVEACRKLVQGVAVADYELAA